MAELTDTRRAHDVREAVREKYAAAALATASGAAACCSPAGVCGVFGSSLYAERESRDALATAGLTEIEIRETHRVHEHAVAGIIRARKPSSR